MYLHVCTHVSYTYTVFFIGIVFHNNMHATVNHRSKPTKDSTITSQHSAVAIRKLAVSVTSVKINSQVVIIIKIKLLT